MLHTVNPDMMRAMARHHPDGRAKDPCEAHRRDAVARLRAARRQSLLALLRKAGRIVRLRLMPEAVVPAQAGPANG